MDWVTFGTTTTLQAAWLVALAQAAVQRVVPAAGLDFPANFSAPAVAARPLTEGAEFAFVSIIVGGLVVSALSVALSYAAQLWASANWAAVAPPDVLAKLNSPRRSRLPYFIVNHVFAAYVFATLVYYLLHVRPFHWATECAWAGLSTSALQAYALVMLYDLQTWLFHFAGHRIS